jgi:AcrR family transcriptional regulator
MSHETPAFAHALARDPLVTTRPTPAAAFVRAREVFQSGERLDMAKLAEELGVARTTLYRWTGDRDQLLSDIMWVEVKELLDPLLAKAQARGYPCTEAVLARFVTLLASAELVRTFISNERERAIWLITAPRAPFRRRLIATFIEMLEDDIAHGYNPPDTPTLLADGAISLAERFLHNGDDPDANPSPEMAQRAIALLLRDSPIHQTAPYAPSDGTGATRQTRAPIRKRKSVV